jgi:hypothetical protein
MEPDDLVGEGEEGIADEVGPNSDKGRRSSVSARQLGASLWESRAWRPQTKNGRKGSVSGVHRQRHGKEVDDEVGVDDWVSSLHSVWMVHYSFLFYDLQEIGFLIIYVVKNWYQRRSCLQFTIFILFDLP